MAALLPVACPATTSPTTRESPFVDLRGKTVGEYSVQKWIHGGSRADVFQGTDAEGRHVAIKVAIKSASDLEKEYYRIKFLTSRQAPVPRPRALFTHDTSDGGQFYRVMVMDYFPSTLEARLRKPEPISHVEILRIAREAITGLSKIHWRSVIHGDINERNLAFDKNGKLVFIGFGQARDLQGFTAVLDEINKKGWQIEVTSASSMMLWKMWTLMHSCWSRLTWLRNRQWQQQGSSNGNGNDGYTGNVTVAANGKRHRAGRLSFGAASLKADPLISPFSVGLMYPFCIRRSG
ncbi:hypothetical protein SPBR_09103 [Sporothrix brasiliensis 5110]|uniref:Protein kinase domain-containing protein n=1 Tax=Sporothrix brasiliensis 5110 TaxID=1398154 RepID=A0A0C2IZI2_9PEZI|nr:uncharacterized protein SPBR_09103 [Sporothrix brasiliensis 5110]KIH92125.1 hypothetical protein SPBR_09103 [Sporothrix brasiliensis 5110]